MKLTLECLEFKPVHRNTLRGFAQIRVAEMRLTVYDVALHDKGGARWVQLPAKPQLKDGQSVKDERGKPAYFKVLEFDNDEVRRAFSDRAIQAVLAFAPDAFDIDEAVS